ncbi:MAG: hypothetical protein ACFCVC_18445, partial [Acidimicrobiia bacterium]
RLEAIAGTIAFRDEIPDIVRDVMRPAQRLTVALVTLTAATTLPVGPVPVEIHKVWRDRDRWTTLVRFRRPVAGMVEAGELRTVDVYSIVSVELTAERFEPLLDDPRHRLAAVPHPGTGRHRTRPLRRLAVRPRRCRIPNPHRRRTGSIRDHHRRRRPARGAAVAAGTQRPTGRTQ